MDSPKTQTRPGLAIGLKVLAIFLFTCLAAAIKAVSDDIPPGQAVFFRAFFAMPVIVVWIWQRGELREALIAKSVTGHMWRGILGTTSMGLTFFGLMSLPLPEVTAIGYATPMFTVVFAAFFLGERVRMFRLSAVAVGLLGVMIVIAPRLSLDVSTMSTGAGLAAVAVLGASILRALVQIHIRTLVKTEHTAAIVFYFSVTASSLALLSVPFGWVWPTPGQAALLVGAGVIGGVAQIIVTSSYRFGGASMLAPFDYTSMIFAAILGAVLFGETPTQTILIGSTLVIAGGAVIIWRERQLGLVRGKAKPLMDPKS